MPMIRLYSKTDKEALMEVFRLNTPTYFHPEEEKDFCYYLDNHSGDYYVAEDSDLIVGSGGINYAGDGKSARLSWDMIRPAAQNKGFGSFLTRYRIDLVKQRPEVEVLTVRTTQLVFPFYRKFGFELIKTEKDYWAAGFDLYHMEMVIR